MRILYANPARHDYLHSTLLEGLNERPDVEVWSLHEGNYGGRAAACLGGDVGAALSTLSSFDAVVIGTTGKHSLLDPAVAAIAGGARSSPSQRWVLVDSGDLGSLPRLGLEWGRFDSIVKREFYDEQRSVSTLLGALALRRMRHPVEYRFHGHPLLPFPNVQCNLQARPAVLAPQRRVARLPSSVRVRCEPIGIERRLVQPFNDHPIREVTCTLAPNTSARRAIRARLDGRPGVRLALIPPDADGADTLVASGAVAPDRRGEHVHNAAYLTWVRSHRASINFPGAGFDTARFWEILAAGSLLIAKRVQLRFPEPLRDGVHYVGFDTLDELDDAVAFALSDSREVDVIRRSGYEFALRWYSSAAVAERFVSIDLAPRRCE